METSETPLDPLLMLETDPSALDIGEQGESGPDGGEVSPLFVRAWLLLERCMGVPSSSCNTKTQCNTA